MTRENIVPCPACDEPIDAVETICETGRCPNPECDTPVSRHYYTRREANMDDSPDTLFDIADPPEEPTDETVEKHYQFEVDA